MADGTVLHHQSRESYQLPELSFDASPLSNLSTPSVARRSSYQRVSSYGSYDLEASRDTTYNAKAQELNASMPIAGLAISNVPFGDASNGGNTNKTGTPDTADSFNSPPTVGTVDDYDANSPFGDNFQHARTTSSGSSTSSHQPLLSVPDKDSLLPRRSGASHNPLIYGPPGLSCKSKRDIRNPRGRWLFIVITALSVYSTLLSATWFIVAVRKPRYGQSINTSSGSLSPINASTLTAILAKSIELSFVTVFVAYLGQVLSSTALSRKSNGINLANMATRSWVLQPGTLITQWKSVKYAGGTVLGILSLLAALVAIFYTTASDTLDAPKLKLGSVEERALYGRVSTTWGNVSHIKDHCQTAIPAAMDPDEYENMCIIVEHAGQAFTNFQQYIRQWVSYTHAGNGSQDLSNRPLPTALLYDNTTVQGSWLYTNEYDMTEMSHKYNRIVNNVTMAMPHTGVVAAASDPINHIMQPQDFDGLGQFYLGASVPSPALNVLCVSGTEKEFAPLVYEKWPAAKNNPVNSFTWPKGFQMPTLDDWGNATVFDDIFGFGQKYTRRPPTFAKFPIENNIILNFTNNYVDALYILANSSTKNYTMCSLSTFLSMNCSTWYNASISGGSMASHCEDPSDPLKYGKMNAILANSNKSKDWVDTATDWAFGVDIGGGISESNDSISRILTQMIPTTDTLNATLPSMAEALAVLAGCTLLVGSIDAPFGFFINYNPQELWNNPQLQSFPAILSYVDYASGPTQPWQHIFYVILLLAFLLNILCLGYFIINGGLVTDFLEPQSLFALAINSPMSQRLAGSCGGGPEGDQLKANWSIYVDDEHVLIAEKNIRNEPMFMSPPEGSHYTYPGSPISESYSKLSMKRRSII